MSPEIAQRLLAALEDLTLNTNEAMKTGGWVPTPLHASFWEAMAEAMEAVHQAKAAPQVAQPQPLTDEQILACVQSVLLPMPMGLTRDRGPYEVTEPSFYLQLLVRAIERAHGIGQERAE